MFRLRQAMEPAIRQYEIQPLEINLSWSKKVVLFFARELFHVWFSLGNRKPFTLASIDPSWKP